MQNPLTILERSVKRRVSEERKGGVFADKIILMDRDVYQRTRVDEKNKFQHRLKVEKIRVILQELDHEGFLIRALYLLSANLNSGRIPRFRREFEEMRKAVTGPPDIFMN